ncbi:Si-specific NAD(P)(+) transhydrogenase [Teredinibacter waterburyi]|uniref:Si-specific NAD(P)(+) transhydrogenase n=1 Tax=Teredinibacter waterburyi TaxID=1500538 RepID=UPI00165EE4C2|nr:Si-specific NAD(P)(+) transhydrogenase [Teredinibacter waterburyi]
MKEFDLVVIGSGPAGQRAAIQACKLGKRAAIVEKNTRVGGVSVHTGTIPSKTVREAVLYLSGWRQRGFYGMNHRERTKITPDDVLERVKLTLSHQVEVMSDQLCRNGVEVIGGAASFVDKNTLAIKTNGGELEHIKAHNILVAVGTRPYRPSEVPFNGSTVLDSDEILSFNKMPRSLTVIGGGVIGIEYATIFAALDVKVTLVEERARVLSFLDSEIIDEFQHQMRDQGVVLRLEETVKTIETDADNRVITTLNSGKKIQTDMLLFAAGRAGSTDSLNLPAAGLAADSRGRLTVNEFFQTQVPHIYAAGDVIGFPSLAATSMVQGRLSACHMFNHEFRNKLEYFPYGIYSVPEISMVGATEQELTQQGIAYETGVVRFREVARGQILGLQQGMLKMLFAVDDFRLLGVHVMGEGATELIHIGQAVITLGGTLDYFVDSAFNYPTLAEAYKVAALNAWNKMKPYRKAIPPNVVPISNDALKEYSDS